MYLISTSTDALQEQNFTYGDYDVTLTLDGIVLSVFGILTCMTIQVMFRSHSRKR